jgi:hypothetical protein
LAKAAYASNLTADPVHGIGAYTNAELVTFLQTGVKRDGRQAMPKPAASSCNGVQAG